MCLDFLVAGVGVLAVVGAFLGASNSESAASSYILTGRVRSDIVRSGVVHGHTWPLTPAEVDIRIKLALMNDRCKQRCSK